MNCLEYCDQIAAHVDGSLKGAELGAFEDHVKNCSECGRKFAWEARVKGLLRHGFRPLQPAPGLKERVLDALEPPRARRPGIWSFPTTALAAAAVFVMLMLPYVAWHFDSEGDIFSGVASQYHRVTAGVPDSIQSSASPARLLDLSPWGYQLLSRRADPVEGRAARVFVYQGEKNDYLVAKEFDGTAFPTLRRARRVTASDKDFFTYREKGVNMVAWKEKDFLCVIASSASQARLLALAKQIATRSS